MYKRKDGLWTHKLILPSGKQKQFYGKTKREVMEKIASYKEESVKGVYFGDVADEWWEYKQKRIQHGSYKVYKPAYERAIATFGGYRINQITPAMVASEIDRFAMSYAHKTVSNQLSVYSMIFKYAVRKGHLAFNPARDISVPTGLKKSKMLPPSSEDIKRIKESLDCTFGLFAYFGLYSGLRKGELLALEWSDVDIYNRKIVVNKSLTFVSNKPVVKSPKTEAGYRVVPLVDALFNVIKPTSGLVFPNKDGKHLTSSQYNDNWEKYIKESGVTCTPHQLRHAFATMLYENNIPVKDAQQILGHAQVQTTLDIYTDIRKSRQDIINSALLGVDMV